MIRIKRPNYVNFDKFGGITDIFCKVCGTQIAGFREVVKGRHIDPATKGWVEQRVRQFQRYPNYAEMKIEFKDGSAHVTNGCSKCLQPSLDLDVLQQLHHADLDMEQMQGNKHTERSRNREPARVVAINTDGGGII